MIFTKSAIQIVAEHNAVEGSAEGISLLPFGGLIGVTLLIQVTRVANAHVQSLLSTRLTNDVSHLVIEKAATLGVPDFDDPETYDRMQRAVSQSGYRPYLVVVDVISAISSLFSLVLLASVLARWNVLVSVSILCATLPTLAVETYFGRVSWREENARTAKRRWIAYLADLVSSDRTVREVVALRLRTYLLQRHRAALDDFYTIDRAIAFRRTLWSALAATVAVVAIAGAIVVGATEALRNDDVGQFAGYIAAVTSVEAAALGLVGGVASIYGHRLFMGDLRAFFDLTGSDGVSGTRPVRSDQCASLSIQEVTFTYPGASRPTLDKVSFEVPPGSLTVLVGANGAGKSTVLRLINRLYEPDDGQILFNGFPIREFDLEALRRNVGVVYQDFLQFETSARENVTLGSIENLESETVAQHAADRAHASTIVSSLNAGWSTRLGRWFDGSQPLSTGQWQRIAIARGLASGAPLLLLDEPSASVDAETEASIVETLKSMRGVVTCVLVTHHMALARHADQVLVLENGQVVEQGTHRTLSRAASRYAQLFANQLADPPGGGPEGI